MMVIDALIIFCLASVIIIETILLISLVVFIKTEKGGTIYITEDQEENEIYAFAEFNIPIDKLKKKTAVRMFISQK